MGNVNFLYTTLFAVSLEQEFYRNGLFKQPATIPIPDFRLTPTEECLAVSKRLDIISRTDEIKSGFLAAARVLGKTGGGDDLLRFPPRSDDKLTYWITLENPEALNFNSVPAERDAQKIFYFTNQRTDAAAPREQLHLTTAALGVDGATDRIQKVTSEYPYHHASELAPGTVKVKHLLTGASIAPYSHINATGQSDLSFDLSPLPLGKCQLLISNVPTAEFYYVGKGAPSSLFGIVELSLASTLDANYRIVESDRSLTTLRPNFRIHFIKRKTKWRYTFHLQPFSKLYLDIQGAADKADFLSRLRIVTNDTAITFSQVSATDTDIVYQSDSEVALQEAYISSSATTPEPLKLELKKLVGDPGEEILRSYLAYPSTNLIDARVSPTTYSDIFITF